MMKLAFCLFHYFPFGGLQRDFLRIARSCMQHGHEVTVYTMSWEGSREPGLPVEIVSVDGWQNHSRAHSFAQQLQQRLLQQNYDLIVGFNKMPGLDLYYAADVCYQSRIQEQRPFWYRWLPRYRQYLRDERAVFASPTQTQILVLSEVQREAYHRCYQTPLERFHLLPPGISRDRLAPANAQELRQQLRQAHQVTEQDNILLMVSSGFKTKGLDRVLISMASLPAALLAKTRLWVVGQDNPKPFLRQAKQLKIADRIYFLGGQHEVTNFYLAADLFVHPAYHENTGTVLLEALAAGLPVLTVDACGYAPYVREAGAGLVLPEPFDQEHFNQHLENMLLSPNRTTWQNQGLAFAKTADIYSLPQKAVEVLESLPPPLKNTLPKHSDSLDYFLQITGEKFRALEGRQTQRVVLENKAYFIKQHYGVGWKEILKNLLQLKLPILSARNEWRAINRLQELSILTPTIKAYGRRGLNPARLESFLLMEEVAPAVSLEDFCRPWKKQPPSFSLKQALIRQVAHIAKTMHEHGINHRDFYLCHFLLKDEPSQLALYLIDLHRAGIHRKLRQRWIIKDLAGLYFSSKDAGLTQRDLWRFMQAYRQQDLRTMLKKEAPFWEKIRRRGEKLYNAHIEPS